MNYNPPASMSLGPIFAQALSLVLVWLILLITSVINFDPFYLGSECTE